MNPNTLSDTSAIRFYTLLVNFPEFKRIYDIKEKLRYEFFMSMDANAARKIAEEVKKTIPEGPIYKPLRTYFKTLESDEWSRYIYAYFDDPIDDPTKPLPEGATPLKRYTNAKLEGFNKIVKEINAAARGLSWEELKAKILYGDLAVKHRPRRFKRVKDPSACPTKMMAKRCIDALIDSFCAYGDLYVHTSLRDDWNTFLSLPKVQIKMKSWGRYGAMSADELIEEMKRNNNLQGAIYSMLQNQDDLLMGLVDSDEDVTVDEYAGDECEEYTVIRPLRFSDWEANKEKYLSIIASDVKFLDKLNENNLSF